MIFSLIVACKNGGGSDDAAPAVVEQIVDNVVTLLIAQQQVHHPGSGSSSSSSNSIDLDLSTRRAISLSGNNEYVSIAYDSKLDAWSNKAFTWSINIVKDSSAGTEFLPIISRGLSTYYVKLDHTNSNVEIKGQHRY